MATTFSAGPHALGYLYQARVALFLLLDCPDESIVKIEALDDIELSTQNASDKLTLTQLKHHISKQAELTDYSPDLWKSIRVWATQVTDRSFALQDTRLNLITTATAAPGSIASLLGVKSRDPKKAEERLIYVSNDSSNKGLLASFNAFKALTPAQRTALVSSITILDQHENIEEYKTKICQLIRPAVRKQYVDSLYERLEGWWFNQAVRHLINISQTPFITAFVLNEKIASLAEGFHEENLPIDFLGEEPDAAFLADSQDKLYVRQLEAIGVKPRVVTKAIFDYYRAFHQRSRWLDEALVFPEELTAYEKLLVDEWERYFDSVCDPSLDAKTEEVLVAYGKRIFEWAELEATHLKIRPRVEADFVRRGSFHILANKEPIPTVHWHPKFIEKVLGTIQVAAKTTK